MNRQQVSDDGNVRRFKVFDDTGRHVGFDDEPSPGSVAGKQAVVAGTVGGAVDNLETADRNWNGLTAAEKDNAARLAVRVAAKLARLQLGRFD